MTMDPSCHFHSYKGPDLIGPFFVCQIPIWSDGINAISAISPSDDKSTPRYTAAYTRPATFSGMNNSSESSRHLFLYIYHQRMILHAFRCLDMKTSTLRMLKDKGLEEIYP